eukprot:TRINITY_DN12468_c0_g1_i10.p1 TRINITY_DN12468_c0_g1~~TRINITY_DN12468_c0_g1_i10.p1  ORF type:complete len:107 (+),score=13.43 TRINITY_DN12468_c0_g1_i10:57-377(+)
MIVGNRHERVKELLSNQDEVDSHDILNDPLTQVFGVDTKGRVRGVGTVVSRSQVIGSIPTVEKLALKEKKIIEQSSSIKNLESQVGHILEEQKKHVPRTGWYKTNA